MSFNAIRENKILAKISESTVQVKETLPPPPLSPFLSGLSLQSLSLSLSLSLK